jgi:hypothetical protein
MNARFVRSLFAAVGSIQFTRQVLRRILEQELKETQ